MSKFKKAFLNWTPTICWWRALTRCTNATAHRASTTTPALSTQTISPPSILQANGSHSNTLRLSSLSPLMARQPGPTLPMSLQSGQRCRRKAVTFCVRPLMHSIAPNGWKSIRLTSWKNRTTGQFAFPLGVLNKFQSEVLLLLYCQLKTCLHFYVKVEK